MLVCFMSVPSVAICIANTRNDTIGTSCDPEKLCNIIQVHVQGCGSLHHTLTSRTHMNSYVGVTFLLKTKLYGDAQKL